MWAGTTVLRLLVAEKMVAAFDAQNAKPCLRERSNEFGARHARVSAHAAMVTRWMPTNSNSSSGAPSISKHNAIASRMRSVLVQGPRLRMARGYLWD